MTNDSSKTAELTQLLGDVEETMVERIPTAFRAMCGRESAYCLFICYHDTSGEEYVPYFYVGFDWCRQKIRSKHGDQASNYLWFQQEVELVDEKQRRNYCKGFGIDEKCDRCLELMSDAAPPDTPEEQLLWPFRSAMHRVAQRLNSRFSKEAAGLTDDFVVLAMDSVGYWLDQDLPASIPADRLTLLKSRGLVAT